MPEHEARVLGEDLAGVLPGCLPLPLLQPAGALLRAATFRAARHFTQRSAHPDIMTLMVLRSLASCC